MEHDKICKAATPSSILTILTINYFNSFIHPSLSNPSTTPLQPSWNSEAKETVLLDISLNLGINLFPTVSS